MNPSIYNYHGKLIVNLRAVNYTFYHSEKKLFQHPYGPLTYLHPENDLKLRTWNYYLELNDECDIRNLNMYSKSYINHLINTNEILASMILTLNNIIFFQKFYCGLFQQVLLA